MFNKTSLALMALLVLLALPALALELHEARRTGLIGEQNDGFVVALKPSADVNALVQDVNGKRQQEYARIAAANGQAPSVVAKLAVTQIVQGLEKGAKYQDAGGSWQTR